METIKLSQQLARSLEGKDQEFINNVFSFYEQFLKELKKIKSNKKQILITISEIDKTIQYSLEKTYKNMTTCKSGCSHCCYINVDVSFPEIKLIEEYIIKYKIPINVMLLKRQYKNASEENWMKMSLEDRKCIFLKDSKCMIYKVRPLVCRKYYVVNNPNLCNTSEMSQKVKIAVMPIPEIIYSVYSTIQDDTYKSLSKYVTEIIINDKLNIIKE